MKHLPLTRIGNPVLRGKTFDLKTAAIIEPQIQEVVQKMISTMRYEQGVGLAANQVGLNLKMFVLECRSSSRYPGSPDIPLAVYFNPKIINYSKDKELDWEGCLSVPGYRGKVERAKTVTFEAFNADGKRVKETVSGFHARIIQHEVDHLNGLFYIDRMENLQSFCHIEEFNSLYQTRILK